MNINHIGIETIIIETSKEKKHLIEKLIKHFFIKILINNRAGPPDGSWSICPGPVLPDGRASHVLIGLVPGHIVTDHFSYMTGSGRGGPNGPPGFCVALVSNTHKVGASL